MAGFPVTKQVVENETGAVVLVVRNALDRVVTVKAWLDDHDDAALQALGFLQADIDQTRAALTDLTNLAKVAHGQGTQAQANDFFFNARHLTGLQ